MKGRSLILLMSIMSLALVLGLVVTLAPDAGAQDSVAAPDGPAKWMRHNIPAANDVEAITRVASSSGTPKTCCIWICGEGALVQTGAAGEIAYPQIKENRWFCTCAGNNH